jgi:hypothetical protein
MPSTDIYTINEPYFYIIKHIPTDKKYAGYKFRNANANTFMSENGYTTSSKEINRLIKETGLESFLVLDIIMEHEIVIPFGWNSVYSYETWFLIQNNCANSDEWINMHNNHNALCSPNNTKISEIRKHSCLIKYGVDNISKIPEIKDKKVQTSLKNFRVNHPNQSEKIKNKTKSTCLKKYNVECVFQSPEIKDKIKSTNLEKYGVEYISQSPEVKGKIKSTNLEKFGVENYGQLDFMREMSRDRLNHINSTIIKCDHCDEMGSIAHIQKYHNNYCPTITGKKRVMAYTHSNLVVCPHCGKIGKSRGMAGTHFDKCPTIRPKLAQITCPHCNKTGNDNGYFKSHHFDKCKTKP